MSDTENTEEEILAIDFMGYMFTKQYFEKYWFASDELRKLAE